MDTVQKHPHSESTAHTIDLWLESLMFELRAADENRTLLAMKVVLEMFKDKLGLTDTADLLNILMAGGKSEPGAPNHRPTFRAEHAQFGNFLHQLPFPPMNILFPPQNGASVPAPAPLVPPPARHARYHAPVSGDFIPPAILEEMTRNYTRIDSESVAVAFFFPEGREQEFVQMRERFDRVIRKHRLKFRMKSVFEFPYQGDIELLYAFIPLLCRKKKAGAAVVIEPPVDPSSQDRELSDQLKERMKKNKHSLQIIPWADLNKNSRYLDLALNITLCSRQ